MSESIDQIVAETADDMTATEKKLVHAYVDDLPDWHPMHRLLTGPSRWVGERKPVYVFLRALCLVYDDYIWPPSADDPSIDAHAEFLRAFPDGVIIRGRRSKMHDLYAMARAAVEAASEDSSAKRAAGLAAFDRAFSELIRAIHVPPPPRRAHASPELRIVHP